MHELPLSRRTLLASAGATGLVLAANLQAEEDGADAIARLKAGNQRFAAGKTRHAHESAQWRKALVGGQKPFATILACSDSRVPPELVFDQGFGELFVIRVAGNVIAADVIGSLQYAVRHLGTPLIVVMGHQECGAVTAAVESLAGKGSEPKYIEALVKLIEPGLADLPSTLTGEARIAAAVEANVRWSIRQLAALPEGRRAIDMKALTLVGAVYDLADGTVRFLS
jgi:carbonic anhydrase